MKATFIAAVTVVVLMVVAAHGHEVVAGAGHQCIHHIVQGPITQSTDSRTFTTASRDSIRIAVDYDNLDDTSKYCTEDSGTKPKHLDGGGTAACTSAYVLTAAKIAILKDKIMPKAVEYIQKLYKVDNLASFTEASPNYCGPNTIVDTQTFTGQDLRIYVTAGPQVSENTLAYAYTCTSRSTGQPTTAVVNFNAKYLTWDDDYDSYNNYYVVQTAIHEIHHALGFSSGYLNSFKQTRTIRGKTVNYVNSTKVLAMARSISGCNASVGVEVEDEGGSGTAGSHWERREVPEELMCGLGGTRLSPFTLAFMEDLGWYDADYSQAQNMTVGRSQGCDFIDEKCNLEAGGKGSAWFFDNDFGCTSDFRMIGKGTWASTTATIPSYEIYDTSTPSFGDASSLADFCPYPNRVSERECEYPHATSLSGTDGIMGMYYGSGGRCFRGSGVKKSSISSSFNSRCFQARCPFGGKRIELAVSDTWIACPIDGSAKSDLAAPTPYEGTIVCPLPSLFCSDDITSGSSEKPVKPVTSNSIEENSGGSRVTGHVTLNGTQWVNAFATTLQKIDILNSFRIDLAFFLGVDYKSLRTGRTTASNSQVTIIIQIIEDGENYLTSAAVADRMDQFAAASTASPSPLALTVTAYAEYGSASEAITIRSYTIVEPEVGSICGDNLTEEKCLMMIGIVVLAPSTLIIWILMYCVCCRDPFDTPPIAPQGGGKKNSTFTDMNNSTNNGNNFSYAGGKSTRSVVVDVPTSSTARKHRTRGDA